MNTNKSLDEPDEADPRSRSLIGVAEGAVDEPTRMRARPPVQPVRGKHKGKGRGRPGTNVRALAKQYSEAALYRLVELIDDKNPCVAVAASKTVLERGHGREPVKHEYIVKERKSKDKKVKVAITRFHKE